MKLNQLAAIAASNIDPEATLARVVLDERARNSNFRGMLYSAVAGAVVGAIASIAAQNAVDYCRSQNRGDDGGNNKTLHITAERNLLGD